MTTKERAVVEAARVCYETTGLVSGRITISEHAWEHLRAALRDLDAERCEDDTWSGTCPTCGSEGGAR